MEDKNEEYFNIRLSKEQHEALKKLTSEERNLWLYVYGLIPPPPSEEEYKRIENLSKEEVDNLFKEAKKWVGLIERGYKTKKLLTKKEKEERLKNIERNIKIRNLFNKEDKTPEEKKELEVLLKKEKARRKIVFDKTPETDKTEIFSGSFRIYTKIPIFENSERIKKHYKMDKIDAFIKQKSSEFAKGDNFEREELYWKAKLHLYEQSSKYNRHKSTFRTWASRVIVNFLISETKKKVIKTISIEEIREPETKGGENKELIKKILSSNLTDKQREVIKMTLEGYNQTEIAEKLKIDVTAVRDRIRGIKKKIENTPK
jgi:RNA polymerase sigma factor (sigma-70 family)